MKRMQQARHQACHLSTKVQPWYAMALLVAVVVSADAQQVIHTRRATPVGSTRMAAPPAVPIEKLPALSPPVYGVSLGEDEAGLLSRIREAGKRIAQEGVKGMFGGQSKEIKGLSMIHFDGALDGTAGVAKTVVLTFNRRVCRIDVKFRNENDASTRAAVLRELHIKFSKQPNAEIYTGKIDGHAVTVMSNWPTVSYVYDGINALVFQETRRMNAETGEKSGANAGAPANPGR